jgi:hypothetical protein
VRARNNFFFRRKTILKKCRSLRLLHLPERSILSSPIRNSQNEKVLAFRENSHTKHPLVEKKRKMGASRENARERVRARQTQAKIVCACERDAAAYTRHCTKIGQGAQRSGRVFVVVLSVGDHNI